MVFRLQLHKSLKQKLSEALSYVEPPCRWLAMSEP